VSACIRIELDDGTNTWVTVVPLAQPNHYGAERAAGEAFVWFLSGLIEDREAVDEHLGHDEHLAARE